MKTIETYLPVFPGFYNTIFEPDEENEIEDVNNYRESKGLKTVDFDKFNFDYKEYNENVSKECVNAIDSQIADLLGDVSIKFQELRSPKKYNFANDAIDVEITFTQDSYNKVIDILESENEAFEAYIEERYTSYDGFMSSYSNNSNEWLNDLKTETDIEHKIGAALEFILVELEGYDISDLWEDIETHSVYASNYYELIEGTIN